MTIYQFVFHDRVQPLENYKGITEYILHEKLSNTEYWVETQYYGIQKFWAWNKSVLRKSGKLQGLGKIGRIIEIN